jgi:hypothetical protein
MSTGRALATGAIAGWFLASATASAAVYWLHGVRNNVVTVCFVGDAVTSRPDRVNEVLRQLREFEYSVNVRFDYLGSCPPSQAQPNAHDSFPGDIRVALPHTAGTKLRTWAGEEGTGPVPGRGCSMFLRADGKYCDSSCNQNANNDDWGSWSDAPVDLAPDRACLYNLKLGDDPWNAPPYLNHTLHEFGHALGLAHEHQRDDVDATLCSEKDYGGPVADGHLTPYDPRSVMHYMFSTCGIKGNYGYTGLSNYDRLGLRILYPEANRQAEYVGATVRRAGESVVLQSAWKTRGVNIEFAAKKFTWKVNNTIHKGPDLSMLLPPGDYPFHYAYRDFLGRSYSAHGRIKVLSVSEYDRLMATTRAAQLPLY